VEARRCAFTRALPGRTPAAVPLQNQNRRPTPHAQTQSRPRHRLLRALPHAGRQRDRRAQIPDYLGGPNRAESAQIAHGSAGSRRPAGLDRRDGEGRRRRQGWRSRQRQLNGTDGSNGKNGVDGSDRAYATVNSSGAFTAIGKNVGSAQRKFEGVYCVSFGGGITPSNSIVIAMPVYSGNKVFLQYDPASNAECTAPNSFAIEAHDAAGNLKDSGFVVMVP
jgi:hypothetical protein